jgi:hypothetical protein
MQAKIKPVKTSSAIEIGYLINLFFILNTYEKSVLDKNIMRVSIKNFCIFIVSLSMLHNIPILLLLLQ